MAHFCVHCASPACQSCIGCKDCPSSNLESTTTTWYCGRDCQKAHFATHKQPCLAARQRKILIQVANAIRDALMLYRKLTVDFLLIGPVERKGNELRFHTDDNKKKRVNPTGLTYLLPEPFWSTVNKKDQLSILSNNFCFDALLAADIPLTYLLKNVIDPNVLIQALLLNIKGHTFTTNDIRDGTAVYEELAWGRASVEHMVGKIRLKSGEEFSLDFTGAQYGMFDVVMPWDKYMSKHVSRIIMEKSLIVMRHSFEWPIGRDPHAMEKRTRLTSHLLDRAMDSFYDVEPAPAVKVKSPEDENAYPEFLAKFSDAYEKHVTVITKQIDPISCVKYRRGLKKEADRKLFDLFHSTKPLHHFKPGVVGILRASHGKIVQAPGEALIQMEKDMGPDGMPKLPKSQIPTIHIK